MEYRPSQPKTNVNISDKNPLKEFFALLGGLLFLILVVYIVLGLLIDITVNYLSTETELSIYEALRISELSRSITANNAFHNASGNEEVGELLNSLTPCADLPYSISLSIDDQSEINAYALPGGYMVVNQGLLENLETEKGLAFVLAHELAHFKNRDHLRSMGRGIVLLTGSILLTGNNSDLSGMFTPAINFQAARYSQSRESQADMTALEILNCRYGNVTGATELFEHLLESEEETLLFSHYFASHPETEKRISNIKNAAF